MLPDGYVPPNVLSTPEDVGQLLEFLDLKLGEFVTEQVGVIDGRLTAAGLALSRFDKHLRDSVGKYVKQIGRRVDKFRSDADRQSPPGVIADEVQRQTEAVAVSVPGESGAAQQDEVPPVQKIVYSTGPGDGGGEEEQCPLGAIRQYIDQYGCTVTEICQANPAGGTHWVRIGYNCNPYTPPPPPPPPPPPGFTANCLRVGPADINVEAGICASHGWRNLGALMDAYNLSFPGIPGGSYYAPRIPTFYDYYFDPVTGGVDQSNVYGIPKLNLNIDVNKYDYKKAPYFEEEGIQWMSKFGVLQPWSVLGVYGVHERHQEPPSVAFADILMSRYPLNNNFSPPRGQDSWEP